MGEQIVWDPTPATAEDDALFEAWDEEAEEAAIAEAAARMNVPCIIIEGKTFAGRFPDGTIIKTPMDFTVAQIEQISEENDNPVDQLKALLRMMGNDKTVEALQEASLPSVLIYAEKYFKAVQQVAQVALGKSMG